MRLTSKNKPMKNLLYLALLLWSTYGFSQANDFCANAIPVYCGSYTGNTTNATTTGVGPNCALNGSSTDSPGLWYKLTGNDQNVTISTCSNATFDTAIDVYNGSCGNLTCVTGNDDDLLCNPTNRSTVSFFASVGQDFLIYVRGFYQPGSGGICCGEFTINIELENYIVTSSMNNGPGSLGEVIDCAPPGSTITFDPSTNGNSILLTSNISLNKDLTIIGNGPANTFIEGLILLEDNITVNFSKILFENSDVGVFRTASLSTLKVTNCVFFNNSSTFPGGAINNEGTASIINSLFHSNFTSSSGGAILNNGNMDLYQNTFASNVANNTAGAIFNAGSITAFYGNILYGNTANIGAADDMDSNAPINNAGNNIIGNPSDANLPFNSYIQANPNFVDAAAGDFHLVSPSPAINGGDQFTLPLDNCDVDGDGTTNEPLPWDLDGQTRVQHSQVDIGCYELDEPCFISPSSIIIGTCDDNDTPTDYTDDFFPITINPSGTGLGYQFLVQAGDPIPPLDYGNTYTLDVLISANSMVLTITDINGGCSESFTSPLPCSGPEICDNKINTDCGDSWTNNLDGKFYKNPCTPDVIIGELFEMTMPYAGDITITLSGFTGDKDLYLYDDYCNSPCEEIDSSYTTNPIETISYAASSGELLSILVKSYDGSMGDYDLSISCTCSETSMVMNSNDSGMGSLRNVIACASNGDVITFHPSTNGNPIALESTIQIDKDLTVIGNGPMNTIFDGTNFIGTSSANNPFFKVSVIGTKSFSKISFRNGEYGVIEVLTSSTAKITNCIFHNNDHGSAGAAIYNHGIATITNCLFYANFSGDSGGAIQNDENATLHLYQNTFSKNQSFQGAAIWNWGTIENFYGNILYGNLPSDGGDLYSFPGSAITNAKNNLIEDPANSNLPANAYITDDPNFEDANNDNFHISSPSPVINGGNQIYLPQDDADLDEDGITNEELPWDLDGQDRKMDGQVDIGCYESGPEICDNVVPISCGANINGNLNGKFYQMPCFSGQVAELYEIQVFNTQDLVITLSGFTGDKDLYLYNTYCNEDCQPIAISTTSSGIESISYNPSQGELLQIIVYSSDGTEGNYNLSLSCSDPCAQDIILISPQDDINNGTQVHETNQNIIAVNKVNGGHGIYRGATEVFLGVGFEVKLGAEFDANNQGCAPETPNNNND